MLNDNSDIFRNYICDILNDWVNKGNFPSILNLNITLVFRKRYRGSKDNYRPESILPVISKVLEKLLCKQITLSLNQLLSKFRCGFWKNYGAQYCLLAIPEHWKSEIDEEKVLGALLTDLSNFFRKKKTSFIGRNSL